MKTAIVNLATIVTGDWRDPYAKGDAILVRRHFRRFDVRH